MYNGNQKTGLGKMTLCYLIPAMAFAGVAYLSLGSLDKVSKALERKNPSVECIRKYAGYSTNQKTIEEICIKK